eukprot:5151448-Lingulodinium_polyedra.AAC.1
MVQNRTDNPRERVDVDAAGRQDAACSTGPLAGGSLWLRAAASQAKARAPPSRVAEPQGWPKP